MTTDEFFLEKIKDGTLEVSKTGVVINLVTAKHIGNGISSGYRRVGMIETLPDGSKRNRTIPVHRLVWLAHKGPIPEGFTVEHKDGDRLNNRLKNFELLTKGDNSAKMHADGRGTGASIAQKKELLRLYKASGERLCKFAKTRPLGFQEKTAAKLIRAEITARHLRSIL